jgi:hypothetical protein
MGTGDQLAMHRVARSVRWAFDIPPFECGGLSEKRCLELLVKFIDATAWLDYTGQLDNEPSQTE